MNKTFFKTCLQQRKTLALSILIFLIVFVAFFTSGYPWFLDGEDMGYLFIVSRLKSLWDAFMHGQVKFTAPFEYTSDCYNIYEETASFVSTYFRPVIVALTYIQYQLFGLIPYPYYAVTISIHAIISVIIFNLLAPCIGMLISSLAAFYFAFHPTTMGWIGKLDTQSAQISTLLGLITLIFAKKGITENNRKYLALSLFMFFICLLSREAFLGLPGIIFFGMNLFITKNSHTSWQSKLFYQFKILSYFSSVIIGYFLLRMWFFPLKSLSHAVVFTLPSFKISSIFSFIYDLFWLHCFPWTTWAFFQSYNLHIVYVVIKIFILLSIISLFITNSAKQRIICMLLSAATFYWQFIFGVGLGIKQLYESLPFVAIGLGLIIGSSALMQKRLLRYVMTGALLTGIMCNAYVVLRYVQSLKKYGITKSNATDNLKILAKNTLIDKPLLYISNASSLDNVGIVQAVWLKGISQTAPHYFLTCIALAPKTSYANAQQNLRIKRIDSGFRITSRDKDKIGLVHNQEPLPNYLKEIIIHDQDVNGKVFDFSLVFKPSSFRNDMVVLAWFFDDEKFLIFDNNEA